MTEAGCIVVARRRDEDLGLTAEAAKGVGVDDTIPITLECSPNVGLGLRSLSAGAASAARRVGRQNRILGGFYPGAHRRKRA
jgi:hypothetical protein